MNLLRENIQTEQILWNWFVIYKKATIDRSHGTLLANLPTFKKVVDVRRVDRASACTITLGTLKSSLICYNLRFWERYSKKISSKCHFKRGLKKHLAVIISSLTQDVVLFRRYRNKFCPFGIFQSQHIGQPFAWTTSEKRVEPGLVQGHRELFYSLCDSFKLVKSCSD